MAGIIAGNEGSITATRRQGYLITTFGQEQSIPRIVLQGDQARASHWNKGWNNPERVIPYPGNLEYTMEPDDWVLMTNILGVEIYCKMWHPADNPSYTLTAYIGSKLETEDMSAIYTPNPPFNMNFGVFPWWPGNYSAGGAYLMINDGAGFGIAGRLGFSPYMAMMLRSASNHADSMEVANFGDCFKDYGYLENRQNTWGGYNGYTYSTLTTSGLYNLGAYLSHYNIGVDWYSDDFLNEWYEGLYVDELITDPDPNTSGWFNGSGAPWGYSNDITDFSSLPTLSAVDSGMLHLYKMNTSLLDRLRNWLSFNVTGGKGILELFTKGIVNPIDYIVQLSILPFDIPAEGSPSFIPFAYMTFDSSNPDMDGDTWPMGMVCSGQYVSLPAGHIDLTGYGYNMFDYATDISLYLPFIGYEHLDCDLSMYHRLDLQYNIDLLSGDCLCEVKAIPLYGSNGQISPQHQSAHGVIYAFRGNCASQIPLRSADFGQIIRGIAGAAVSVGKTDPLGVAGNLAGALQGGMGIGQTSGQFTNNMFRMGAYTPHLILSFPQESMPSNYTQIEGRPANVYGQISSIGSGFFQIEEDTLKIEAPTATEEERNEIIALLEGGVII